MMLETQDEKRPSGLKKIINVGLSLAEITKLSSLGNHLKKSGLIAFDDKNGPSLFQKTPLMQCTEQGIIQLRK